MCGIAGAVHRRGTASESPVVAQLRLLDHRGPDSWGVFASGRAAIGQTRLAIIDLVTGDPPITTPDGSIGVALNGEIYNFGALRTELAGRGHVLRTLGDTEVIAHLAEELEPVELAQQLHGMFAFAIWDANRERLVLGRDRFGKKPLYWWRGANEIVFASEIKALLAHPSVHTDLDEAAIPSYLHLGYVPTPRTFYAGVESVPPGHVLIVDRNLEVTQHCYWRLDAAGMNGRTRIDADLNEASALVADALERSVSDRMVSDVPLGAFLSGGIDSSLVVALMARHSTTKVRTFTIGFEDATHDERRWAATVAQHIGTEHTEFVVKPSAVDLVEKLVWHHDQPFGDSSAIPTYLLSELTAREVTVALAGDGGDELFGGYERFSAALLAHRLRPLARLARRSRGAMTSSRGSRFGRFLSAAPLPTPDALREWASYIPSDLVEELTGTPTTPAAEHHRSIWSESEGAALLDRILLLTMRTYLLDDLLPKVDRMSMAHALEVRAPFLDHRLAELALRLRPRTKATAFHRKGVLRQLGRGLIPQEVLDRPKKGFGVPLDMWFRTDLAPYVTSMLGATARVRAHVRGDLLDRLLHEHATSAVDHGDALWSLLTLEVFLRDRDW